MVFDVEVIPRDVVGPREVVGAREAVGPREVVGPRDVIIASTSRQKQESVKKPCKYKTN